MLTDASILITSPLDHPLHFVGLELVVFACFGLTAHHAIGHYRRGDRYHLFQWLVIFFYGVVMELIAFNFLHNYNHAQFTVQLYRGELPLYIPCIYIVLHYTGLKSVERLDLPRVPEAVLVGFAICLLDVPFDISGVDAGWWTWTTTDPNLADRWVGVPVTSYYWYMVFGGCFAALCRGLRGTLARRSLAVYIAAAPIVAVLVVVAGTLAFLPFHVLKGLGVAAGTIVLAHMVACAGLALYCLASPANDARTLPVSLRFIVFALNTWLVGVFLGLWRSGEVLHAPVKLGAIALAATGATAVAWGLPSRTRAPRPDGGIPL